MDEKKAKYIEGVGWRSETDTTSHHRESLWDYKGRAIYHITITTEERQPIFGALTGENEEEAFIVYSRLGEYVDSTFRGLPAFFAKKGVKLRVLAVRVMPDHLHGVIQVLEPMPKSIGEVVRSFKSACTSWFKRQYAQGGSGSGSSSGKNAGEMHKQAAPAAQPAAVAPVGAALLGVQSEATQRRAGLAQVLEERLVHFCRIFATRGSIWEHMPAGYHERVLHCDGQLDRMIRYVKDNPRRLWLKRHRPHLFKLHNDVLWEFTDEQGRSHSWRFRALGNMFLLDYPQKQHIQCSRSITPTDLEQRYEHWLGNAQQGVVSVTSAISSGEKTVTKRLREAGLPLVVMLKDGFPPVGSPLERYFKPGGVYFDACAAGRLLLLEPFGEVLDDALIAAAVQQKAPQVPRHTTRYHFLALNKVGEMLTSAAGRGDRRR